MLNLDRRGHRYPTFHYEVSREKVREYAEATKVDDPAYRADPATVPSAEMIAPPTFAACLTVARSDLFDDPELGAHPNLVHAGQSFAFHTPIRVGRTLACTPRITEIVDRGRMQLLTLETACVDAETSAPVVTGTMTLAFLDSEDA